MKKNMVIMLTLLAFSSMAFVRVEATQALREIQVSAKDLKAQIQSIQNTSDVTSARKKLATFAKSFEAYEFKRSESSIRNDLSDALEQMQIDLVDADTKNPSSASPASATSATPRDAASLDSSSSHIASVGGFDSALPSKGGSLAASGSGLFSKPVASLLDSSGPNTEANAAEEVEEDLYEYSDDDFESYDSSSDNEEYHFEKDTGPVFVPVTIMESRFDSLDSLQPHAYFLSEDNSEQIQELAGRIAEQSALLFANTGASRTHLEYLIADVLKQAVHEGLRNAQTDGANLGHTAQYYNNIIIGFLNEVAIYSAVPYTTLDSGAVNRIGESVTAELYRIAESLSKMPKAMSPDKRQAVAAGLILFKINKMAEKEGISKTDATNYPPFVIAFLEKMFNAQIQKCTSREALAIKNDNITAFLKSIASQMHTQKVATEILDRIFDETNGIDPKVKLLVTARTFDLPAPKSGSHSSETEDFSTDHSPTSSSRTPFRLRARKVSSDELSARTDSWRRTEERPEAAALLVDEDTTPQWTEETTDPYNKFLGKPVKSKNVYSGLQKWKKDRLKPAARR